MALYLAENYREKITDEKLQNVAKEFNYRSRVLKKHYEFICSIKDIFEKE